MKNISSLLPRCLRGRSNTAWIWSIWVIGFTIAMTSEIVRVFRDHLHQETRDPTAILVLTGVILWMFIVATPIFLGYMLGKHWNEDTALRTNQPGYCRAARMGRVWLQAMRAAGYGGMCDYNSQFNYIDYNYTRDSTPECRMLGEVLWKHLMEQFGKVPDQADECDVEISRGSFSSITRDKRLWDKEWPAGIPVLDKPLDPHGLKD